jgi:UDP-GlcNAc:undecaprenyl-phosphate GlcNAc-1-phosphate transferase
MPDAPIGPAVYIGAVAALAVSAAVSGLVAWCGPVDRPRARGAHDRPTPTAGGLGLMAGAAAGLIVFCALQPPGAEGVRIAAAFGFAAALGLLGAVDDLYDLGARTKLLIQAALAFAFAVLIARIETIPLAPGFGLPLGPAIGALGTALWLVVATNAVNFMDGVNGLAAGSMAITLAAFGAAALLGGAGTLGAAALVGAAAALGFLPWNFPRARLFQGDAGALFSSFLLAALAVIGAGADGRGPVFLLFAPLALLPLLADVLLTLLRRARAGERLLDAHKSHLYQRWFAARGASHAGVSSRAWAATAAFSAAALAVRTARAEVQTATFVGGVVVAALAWAILSRRCDRRG